MFRRQRQPDNPERILVVVPNWIGDVVLATPVLRTIRRRYPDAHIGFLGRLHAEALLSASGWANEHVSWPERRGQTGWRFGTLRLVRDLRRRRFDWAVLLTNSFRSALVCTLAMIPRRIGVARDGRGWMLTDSIRAPKANGSFVPRPMIDYYADIAEIIDCHPASNRLELATSPEDEASLGERLAVSTTQEGPPAIISPGASYGDAKCWMPERFAELGDRLAREQGARVVITCGPGEEPLARYVREQMKESATLLTDPLLTLGQMKALVKRSELVVCNDTGPRHFAIAFGVPVVTIFGPTDPQWTETNYPLERKVLVKVDCSLCQLKVCPVDHRCMTRIDAGMVYEKCAELLRIGRAEAHARERTHLEDSPVDSSR